MEKEERVDGGVFWRQLTGHSGRLDVRRGRGQEIKDDVMVAGSLTRLTIDREESGRGTQKFGCATFQVLVGHRTEV